MSITQAQQARTDKFLDKLIRFTLNGSQQITTHRGFIAKLVQAGYTPIIEEDDKIKPMSRMQFFRATQQEQEAHAKRVKEGGKKNVYYMVKDDSCYQVNKTLFDLAKSLLT